MAPINIRYVDTPETPEETKTQENPNTYTYEDDKESSNTDETIGLFEKIKMAIVLVAVISLGIFIGVVAKTPPKPPEMVVEFENIRTQENIIKDCMSTVSGSVSSIGKSKQKLFDTYGITVE